MLAMHTPCKLPCEGRQAQHVKKLEGNPYVRTSRGDFLRSISIRFPSEKKNHDCAKENTGHKRARAFLKNLPNHESNSRNNAR